MAEGDSNFTFNYITDDPCHDCMFSRRIPESRIDNPFSRRFGCVNQKRLRNLVEMARDSLEHGNSVSDLYRAKSCIDKAVAMYAQLAANGYFDCEEYTVGTPECHVKQWGVKELDSLELLESFVYEEVHKSISSNGEDFQLPIDIWRVVNESDAIRHRDKDEASKVLRTASEMACSFLDGNNLECDVRRIEFAKKVLKIASGSIEC